ncbi:hypothetical protein DC429_05145 [Arthrobacter sp. TPD3018]|nr:hypothetical protein DC425_05135 [Sphingomonas sp. TPD3009]PVE61287.1 hypothetical protein DC429_05145 [Arthrobacter sp. TPD3018]PVE85794.1 hypothetical protein DC431_08040 [Sphingomonas melonis]
MRSSGARGRKIDNMNTLTKTIGGDRFDLCGDRVGRGGLSSAAGVGGRGGVGQGVDDSGLIAGVCEGAGPTRVGGGLAVVFLRQLRVPLSGVAEEGGSRLKAGMTGVLGGLWWPYSPRHPGLSPGSTLRRGGRFEALAFPLRPGGPRNKSGVTR